MANGYVAGEGRRYRSRLALTEKGVRVAESIVKKIDGVVEWASADVDGADRAAMYRALAAISARLENRGEKQ